MKRMWILVALTAALAATGCKKGGETCEKFVDRSLSCDGDETAKMSSDEKSQYKVMMAGMCEAAFSDETAGAEGDTKKMMLEMYATVRTKAKCVAEAKDCAAAKACDAKDY
jgi:hypothetical protein